MTVVHESRQFGAIDASQRTAAKVAALYAVCAW
jgi:hypothetical protein